MLPGDHQRDRPGGQKPSGRPQRPAGSCGKGNVSKMPVFAAAIFCLSRHRYLGTTLFSLS